ncbi:hypothetical protein OIB37_21250 [Streptomyces sp. NBC_00820]|uniref:hypothetical protein n=1 Tax=Streptomyces sp. NBC_00820 TaxID=2975842 RepID=UPI002ECFCE6C|nr:hypothetical protein OIB37_21250 [Streptomyces sp. NBC_00820]
MAQQEPTGQDGDGAAGRDRAELARLRARVATLEAGQREGGPRRHRVRSALAAVLIVLGCVLAPLAVVAAWSADLVGDTDRYVATVAPLSADPAVQNAVADRATDAVMDHLDLSTLLRDIGPNDRPLAEKALGALGGSLQAAVRSFVHDKAREVVASDAFAAIWRDANRRVHAAVDKALTGSGGGAVKLENDAVTIDLAPVIEQVKTRLVDSGLTVAKRIPQVHAQFTVLRSDEIGRLQTYFRLLQLAGTWLPVLAALLLAAGVLAATRRRRALAAAALGVAFAVLVLGIGLTVFRAVYLDKLPSGVSRPAAAAVYDTLTRFLRTAVRALVALGVTVAVAAWLTGPGRHARAVRQVWHAGLAAARAQTDRFGLRTGPVGPFLRRYRAWITWLLVAAAVVAYVLWSHPTGWVVVGLALALLFALTLLDFLAVEETGPPVEESAGPSAGGPGPAPRSRAR